MKWCRGGVWGGLPPQETPLTVPCPPGGSGGLRPPGISVNYPCLASLGGRSPPIPVPCPRALPPIFFRPNFFVRIFSSEFFRPNLFVRIFSSKVALIKNHGFRKVLVHKSIQTRHYHQPNDGKLLEFKLQGDGGEARVINGDSWGAKPPRPPRGARHG